MKSNPSNITFFLSVNLYLAKKQKMFDKYKPKIYLDTNLRLKRMEMQSQIDENIGQKISYI